MDDRALSRQPAGGAAPDVSGWTLGLALPPRLTVSDWADDHRIIAQGTGPEEGRWRTERAPFQREPMDVILDPDVEILVLMWSSQVGKTEVLINILSYFIAQEPAPQLLVLPTLQLAESFSRSRLGPTINATPALVERIGLHNSRATDTTILEKTYPGGDIVLAGANSPTSLASRPRRIVAMDEVDKYKGNIGHDGDPIKQAFQRTQNFWNAKKILASTPTIAGLSVIEEWFRRSDQRHFEVPCHHCGTFQSLEWEQVDWPGKGTDAARPDEAVYLCRDCGGVWEERDRHVAVRHGIWKARAGFAGIAGFAVNALASPWVSLAELAREWEESRGKPGEEQTFENLKLGRAYSPLKAAATAPEQLIERREDYGPELLPKGCILVTAFVDVQADRFEVQYLGFGIEDEKWVADYRVLWADTSVPASWERLDAELLARTFPSAHGGELPIEAIGIDAGYLQQMVLEFCRSRREAFRPFYAVKGAPGEGRPLWRQSDERFKMGAKLYVSGVDDGKTQLYQELAVTEPRPRVHFPRHLDIDYFRQLVSEKVKITFRSGKPVRAWDAGGRRNEALDTFVGCVAVRHALSVNFAARLEQLNGSATASADPYAGLAAMFGR